MRSRLEFHCDPAEVPPFKDRDGEEEILAVLFCMQDLVAASLLLPDELRGRVSLMQASAQAKGI